MASFSCAGRPKQIERTKMFHRSSLTVLAAAIFTTCGSVSLQANVITNGSFESPVVPVGSYLDYASGSTAIPGWTVVGAAGGVSIVNGTTIELGVSFPAEDGAQYLDLTGDGTNAVEGVEQTFSTTIGTNYTVTFWVGNVDNPGSNPSSGWGTTSTVNVKLGGLGGTLLDSVTNSMTNSTTQTWEMFTTSFAASGSTTTIDFLNGDPANDNTNGLDNVSITATSTTPEPSSVVLLGSALGVLAFWSRKRTYRG
jgi:hypothetical protein